MDKAEGFEVTEYGKDESGYAAFAALKQIVSELARTNPAFAVTSRLEGGNFVLQYHCYEMHMPSRIRMIHEQAEQVFKETLKHLKKEFKAKTSKALSLKELKDKAGNNIQKVSLNERYAYLAWRVYELG